MTFKATAFTYFHPLYDTTMGTIEWFPFVHTWSVKFDGEHVGEFPSLNQAKKALKAAIELDKEKPND